LNAIFIELPAFARHRDKYLDDEGFRELQNLLMNSPGSGVVIPGTGGLRKLRFVHARRGKGKRGGLRVIYYWWVSGMEFWLFTLYDKDDMPDLTRMQRQALADMVKAELEARRIKWLLH